MDGREGGIGEDDVALDVQRHAPMRVSSARAVEGDALHRGWGRWYRRGGSGLRRSPADADILKPVEAQLHGVHGPRTEEGLPRRSWRPGSLVA